MVYENSSTNIRIERDVPRQRLERVITFMYNTQLLEHPAHDQFSGAQSDCERRLQILYRDLKPREDVLLRDFPKLS